MESQALLNIMTAAVVISAIALVLQACFLGVMAMTAKRVKDQVDQLTPKAESLMATAESTLAENKKRIEEITTKAS